ncbi:hypothetical protein B566_EDAN013643, partial [Ephemera danica]
MMGMEANRGRSGSIAAPAAVPNAGGYLAGPQLGYSRQEGAMSPFATTGRRRTTDVRSPQPYYPRGGPTGSVHELRNAGLATTSVHDLHQQHMQQHTGSVHELHQQHMQQHAAPLHDMHQQHLQQQQQFNPMQQAQSLAHLNCPSCHNAIWAAYPQPNMQQAGYGHEHHLHHDPNYRGGIPHQSMIPRSNSTVSVNVPYAEYEHRRQMEQVQQWDAPQQRQPQQQQPYQPRQPRRAPSPSPSNKSRTKSLPGTSYGNSRRNTTTSESEEEENDENCEEIFSSSQAHEESDGEEYHREPEVAPYKWECEHCTYINPEGTRVCSICCKTPTGKFRLAPNEVPNSIRRTSKPSIRRGSAKQQIAARRRQEQELRAKEEAQERRRFRQLDNEAESESLDDDYAAVKRGTSRPSSRKSSRSHEEPYKVIKVKSDTTSRSRQKENHHEIIKPEPIRYAPPPPPPSPPVEVVEKKGYDEGPESEEEEESDEGSGESAISTPAAAAARALASSPRPPSPFKAPPHPPPRERARHSSPRPSPAASPRPPRPRAAAPAGQGVKEKVSTGVGCSPPREIIASVPLRAPSAVSTATSPARSPVQRWSVHGTSSPARVASPVPRRMLSSVSQGTSPARDIPARNTRAPSVSIATSTSPAREALQERGRNSVSTGTSPPPQTIATQTYDVLPGASRPDHASSTRDSRDSQRYSGRLKRAMSLHTGTQTLLDSPDVASLLWGPEARAPNHLQPRRTLSRHSLFSDTQSLPMSGPTSRETSPGAETDEPLPSMYDSLQRPLNNKQLQQRRRQQLRGVTSASSELGTPSPSLMSSSLSSLLRVPSSLSQTPTWALDSMSGITSKTSTLTSFNVNRRGERMRTGSQPALDLKQRDHGRNRGDTMKFQGLELVRLLRQAEEHNFTADDVQVALAQCGGGGDGDGLQGGDGPAHDPIEWLRHNWRNLIDTVATLATNYGHERAENTVGNVSAIEARDALRIKKGDVWQAVTHCVEQRQKKYAELLGKGNFTRQDVVSALEATQGNVDAALTELNKAQLKPFLMRIWGPPVGSDNEAGNLDALAAAALELQQQHMAERAASRVSKSEEFEDDQSSVSQFSDARSDVDGLDDLPTDTLAARSGSSSAGSFSSEHSQGRRRPASTSALPYSAFSGTITTSPIKAASPEKTPSEDQRIAAQISEKIEKIEHLQAQLILNASQSKTNLQVIFNPTVVETTNSPSPTHVAAPDIQEKELLEKTDIPQLAGTTTNSASVVPKSASNASTEIQQPKANAMETVQTKLGNSVSQHIAETKIPDVQQPSEIALKAAQSSITNATKAVPEAVPTTIQTVNEPKISVIKTVQQPVSSANITNQQTTRNDTTVIQSPSTNAAQKPTPSQVVQPLIPTTIQGIIPSIPNKTKALEQQNTKQESANQAKPANAAISSSNQTPVINTTTVRALVVSSVDSKNTVVPLAIITTQPSSSSQQAQASTSVTSGERTSAKTNTSPAMSEHPINTVDYNNQVPSLVQIALSALDPDMIVQAMTAKMHADKSKGIHKSVTLTPDQPYTPEEVISGGQSLNESIDLNHEENIIFEMGRNTYEAISEKQNVEIIEFLTHLAKSTRTEIEENSGEENSLLPESYVDENETELDNTENVSQNMVNEVQVIQKPLNSFKITDYSNEKTIEENKTDDENKHTVIFGKDNNLSTQSTSIETVDTNERVLENELNLLEGHSLLGFVPEIYIETNIKTIDDINAETSVHTNERLNDITNVEFKMEVSETFNDNQNSNDTRIELETFDSKDSMDLANTDLDIEDTIIIKNKGVSEEENVNIEKGTNATSHTDIVEEQKVLDLSFINLNKNQNNGTPKEIADVNCCGFNNEFLINSQIELTLLPQKDNIKKDEMNTDYMNPRILGFVLETDKVMLQENHDMGGETEKDIYVPNMAPTASGILNSDSNESNDAGIPQYTTNEIRSEFAFIHAMSKESNENSNIQTSEIQNFGPSRMFDETNKNLSLQNNKLINTIDVSCDTIREDASNVDTTRINDFELEKKIRNTMKITNVSCNTEQVNDTVQKFDSQDQKPPPQTIFGNEITNNESEKVESLFETKDDKGLDNNIQKSKVEISFIEAEAASSKIKSKEADIIQKEFETNEIMNVEIESSNITLVKTTMKSLNDSTDNTNTIALVSESENLTSRNESLVQNSSLDSTQERDNQIGKVMMKVQEINEAIPEEKIVNEPTEALNDTSIDNDDLKIRENNISSDKQEVLETILATELQFNEEKRTGTEINIQTDDKTIKFDTIFNNSRTSSNYSINVNEKVDLQSSKIFTSALNLEDYKLEDANKKFNYDCNDSKNDIGLETKDSSSNVKNENESYEKTKLSTVECKIQDNTINHKMERSISPDSQETYKINENDDANSELSKPAIQIETHLSDIETLSEVKLNTKFLNKLEEYVASAEASACEIQSDSDTEQTISEDSFSVLDSHIADVKYNPLQKQPKRNKIKKDNENINNTRTAKTMPDANEENSTIRNKQEDENIIDDRIKDLIKNQIEFKYENICIGSLESNSIVETKTENNMETSITEQQTICSSLRIEVANVDNKLYEIGAEEKLGIILVDDKQETTKNLEHAKTHSNEFKEPDMDIISEHFVAVDVESDDSQKLDTNENNENKKTTKIIQKKICDDVQESEPRTEQADISNSFEQKANQSVTDNDNLLVKESQESASLKSTNQIEQIDEHTPLHLEKDLNNSMIQENLSDRNHAADALSEIFSTGENKNGENLKIMTEKKENSNKAYQKKEARNLENIAEFTSNGKCVVLEKISLTEVQQKEMVEEPAPSDMENVDEIDTNNDDFNNAENQSSTIQPIHSDISNVVINIKTKALINIKNENITQDYLTTNAEVTSNVVEVGFAQVYNKSDAVIESLVVENLNESIFKPESENKGTQNDKVMSDSKLITIEETSNTLIKSANNANFDVSPLEPKRNQRFTIDDQHQPNIVDSQDIHKVEANTSCLDVTEMDLTTVGNELGANKYVDEKNSCDLVPPNTQAIKSNLGCTEIIDNNFVGSNSDDFIDTNSFKPKRKKKMNTNEEIKESDEGWNAVQTTQYYTEKEAINNEVKTAINYELYTTEAMINPEECETGKIDLTATECQINDVEVLINTDHEEKNDIAINVDTNSLRPKRNKNISVNVENKTNEIEIQDATFIGTEDNDEFDQNTLRPKRRAKNDKKDINKNNSCIRLHENDETKIQNEKINDKQEEINDRKEEVPFVVFPKPRRKSKVAKDVDDSIKDLTSSSETASNLNQAVFINENITDAEETIFTFKPHKVVSSSPKPEIQASATDYEETPVMEADGFILVKPRRRTKPITTVCENSEATIDNTDNDTITRPKRKNKPDPLIVDACEKNYSADLPLNVNTETLISVVTTHEPLLTPETNTTNSLQAGARKPVIDINNAEIDVKSYASVVRMNEASYSPNSITNLALSTDEQDISLTEVKSAALTKFVLPELKMPVAQQNNLTTAMGASPLAGFLKRGFSLDADKFSANLVDPEQLKQREFE